MMQLDRLTVGRMVKELGFKYCKASYGTVEVQK